MSIKHIALAILVTSSMLGTALASPGRTPKLGSLSEQKRAFRRQFEYPSHKANASLTTPPLLVGSLRGPAPTPRVRMATIQGVSNTSALRQVFARR